VCVCVVGARKNAITGIARRVVFLIKERRWSEALGKEKDGEAVEEGFKKRKTKKCVVACSVLVHLVLEMPRPDGTCSEGHSTQISASCTLGKPDQCTAVGSFSQSVISVDALQHDIHMNAATRVSFLISCVLLSLCLSLFWGVALREGTGQLPLLSHLPLHITIGSPTPQQAPDLGRIAEYSASPVTLFRQNTND
jgi:hypothetical protein